MFEKSPMGELNSLTYYRATVESAWRNLYNLCDPKGSFAKQMPTDMAVEVEKTVRLLNAELDHIDEQCRNLRGRMI